MDEREQSPVIHSGDAEAVGRRLREARCASGRSVRDVGAELRLPAPVVESLESGRLDTIAPLYLRGYVRAYADLLGLDADELVGMLPGEEAAPLKTALAPRRPAPRFEPFLKFATYALVTTMIVPPLVYFFVTGGTRLFDAPDAPPATAVEDAGEATDGEGGLSRRIAGALNLVERDAGDGEDGRHLSASAVPIDAMRPGAADTGNAPAPDSDPAPASETETAGPVLSSLRLELDEDSWVEIEDARGQRLEFDLLRAGAQRDYEGVAPIRVLLGRASAASLWLDGEPVEFRGSDSGGFAEFELGSQAEGG